MGGMQPATMASAPAFVSDVLRSPEAPKLLTLVLVVRPNQILLGMKKRGFGQGYYNGFGGKVEAGETVEQAAHRELEEEACIRALDMELVGCLTFIFDDQARPWEVHVFKVTEYEGEPAETEEMAPQWFDHKDIPYNQMWADDEFWYPLLLTGKTFSGVFAFTQTTKLLWHNLETADGCVHVDWHQRLVG